MDPWGHIVGQSFADYLEEGLDVRPTIAVTRARLRVPEFDGGGFGLGLKPDGNILLDSGEVNVIKIAIEPVW